MAALFSHLLFLLLFLTSSSFAASSSSSSSSSSSTCGPAAACIWSNSRSRNYHLATVLRRALQADCNPCVTLTSSLSLCPRSSGRSRTAAIYFDPFYEPTTREIRSLLDDDILVFRILFGDLERRRQRVVTFKAGSRRLAPKKLQSFANRICDSLRLKPTPTATATATPSPTPVLPDFNRRRIPRFNLKRLQTLFETIFELEQAAVNVNTEGQLIDIPASPSPSPSPPLKKNPWVWRFFSDKPQHSTRITASVKQQVVQTCGRSNCAARVTIFSARFIRRQLITRALNIIRSRPSFSFVFNTNRDTFTVERQGNRVFVVIIPFRQQYLAEF